MSMSFVEAAVLSSTDGVSHGVVKELTSEERDTANKLNENRRDDSGSKLSLRDQLAENKEKFEEVRAAERNPFKPPRGLDEDELEFLNESETLQKEKEDIKKHQEKLDTEAFKSSRMTAVKPIDEDSIASALGGDGGSLFAFDNNTHASNDENYEENGSGKQDAKTTNGGQGVVNVKSKKKKSLKKKKKRKRNEEDGKLKKSKKGNSLGLLGSYSESDDDD